MKNMITWSIVSVVLGIILGWTSFSVLHDVTDSEMDITIGELHLNSDDLEVVEGLGDYNAEAVFVPVNDPGIPVPNLKREVVGLTEKTQEKLDTVIAVLEKDHLDTGAWVEIGGLWKVGGAFNASVEAWEYALALSPTQPVALVNLGNLYTTDIPDLKKAEKWYLKAIETSPANVYAYLKTAELYLYQMDNRKKALKIIEQGLSVVPSDGTLESFKDALEAGTI